MDAELTDVIGTGTLRIEFDFCPPYPYMCMCRMSFVHTPSIDFKLSVVGSPDVMDLVPPLRTHLLKMIDETVGECMMGVNPLEIPLYDWYGEEGEEALATNAANAAFAAFALANGFVMPRLPSAALQTAANAAAKMAMEGSAAAMRSAMTATSRVPVPVAAGTKLVRNGKPQLAAAAAAVEMRRPAAITPRPAGYGGAPHGAATTAARATAAAPRTGGAAALNSAAMAAAAAENSAAMAAAAASSRSRAASDNKPRGVSGSSDTQAPSAAGNGYGGYERREACAGGCSVYSGAQQRGVSCGDSGLTQPSGVSGAVGGDGSGGSVDKGGSTASADPPRASRSLRGTPRSSADEREGGASGGRAGGGGGGGRPFRAVISITPTGHAAPTGSENEH